MDSQGLKRVTVTSEAELTNWLRKNADHNGDVMVVTHADARSDKHISSAQLAVALKAEGWISTRSYSVNKAMTGHVIRRA